MVDPKQIQKAGGTPEKLKALFAPPSVERKPLVNELIELNGCRIRDGVRGNFSDARNLWALDRAYDVPRRQTTYTLVEGLLDRRPSSDEVLSMAKSWGLSSMLIPAVDSTGAAVCDATGRPGWTFDLPTFFRILMPVCLAYSNIRWAKLWTDRNLHPLYKYEPLTQTMKLRLKAEVVTGRISRMTAEMDYRSIERTSILHTLIYGRAITFPMEPWYCEKQLNDGKETIVREGVRWTLPHPSRTFIDGAHPAYSLNSDTGCEFGGYWDAMRWGALKADKRLWNAEKVSYGSVAWLREGWFNYMSFYPCGIQLPDCLNNSISDANDRLRAELYKDASDKDKLVLVAPLFHKLNPKEWGLFDYDYPVWFRFLFAGDDTVLDVQPLAYAPMVASLYDHDPNRENGSSLVLQALPWQDLLGNYLTQQLLSVKQNLAKVVFWNAQMLKKEEIDMVRNLGEKTLRAPVFIPFTHQEWEWEKTSAGQAFYPVEFPKANTAEIANAILLMVSLMERMLGFSSQEVGTAAAHQQSAREVTIIESNSSVRLELTGSFIDSAIHARKQRLYEAMLAYSDDSIFAQVAQLSDLKKSALKELGFEVEEDQQPGGARAGVRGPKSSLTIDAFSSEREGANRFPSEKIAVSMLQAWQIAFGNPVFIQSYGIEPMIELFNRILVYAGFPGDWKLPPPEKSQTSPTGQTGPTPEEQGQAAVAQIGQIVEALLAKALPNIGEAIKTEVVAPIAEKLTQHEQALGELINHAKETDDRDMLQDRALAKVNEIFAAAAGGALPPGPELANGASAALPPRP